MSPDNRQRTRPRAAGVIRDQVPALNDRRAAATARSTSASLPGAIEPKISPVDGSSNVGDLFDIVPRLTAVLRERK